MKARRERVYVLPGNHESAARHRRHFANASASSTSTARRPRSAGVRFAGLGYSTMTPFDTPGEYGEDEIAERLEKFAAWKPQVLICHSPPLDTPLDRIKEGLHGGSRAVREFIEKHQPEYFFCGHIHEAEGVVIQMGATRAMNVGKKGYLLEV